MVNSKNKSFVNHSMQRNSKIAPIFSFGVLALCFAVFCMLPVSRVIAADSFANAIGYKPIKPRSMREAKAYMEIERRFINPPAGSSLFPSNEMMADNVANNRTRKVIEEPTMQFGEENWQVLKKYEIIEYNRAGQLIKHTRYDPKTRDIIGVSYIKYDSAGRVVEAGGRDKSGEKKEDLVKLFYHSNGALKEYTHYSSVMSFDNNGNLTNTTNSRVNNTSYSFSYKSDGRLDEINRPVSNINNSAGCERWQYSYDGTLATIIPTCAGIRRPYYKSTASFLPNGALEKHREYKGPTPATTTDTTFEYSVDSVAIYGLGRARTYWFANEKSAQVVKESDRFRDLGDGSLFDKSTELQWVKLRDVKSTYRKASAACERLSLGGRRDWGLPTIKQLDKLFTSEPSDRTALGEINLTQNRSLCVRPKPKPLIFPGR